MGVPGELNDMSVLAFVDDDYGSSINGMIYHQCDPEGKSPALRNFVIVEDPHRFRRLGATRSHGVGIYHHEEVCSLYSRRSGC